MTGADNELRCNNLRCRTLVAQQGKAVVTTCSHIFCIPCGNDLFQRGEVCPACDQALTEPSDIVESYLNPANDYKATVLAGLHPSTIMEIATRATGFWTYQTSQESAFQTMMRQNIQAKADKLERQLQIANGNLQAAEKRAVGLQSDLEVEQRRLNDAQLRLKESERELVRLRTSSNKMKTQALINSAAVGAQMADNRSSSSHDFIPTRPPYHGAPAGHQAPAPFVPTPARGGGANTPRDMLSKYNLRRLNQTMDPGGPGGVSRGEMTPRGMMPSSKRPPLTAMDVNASHRYGAQARPPSKLAQRRTVGPAEYGTPY